MFPILKTYIVLGSLTNARNEVARFLNGEICSQGNEYWDDHRHIFVTKVNENYIRLEIFE